MNDAKIFLRIGACLCILIGALCSDVMWLNLFPRSDISDMQAFVLILYALLAFVPFIVFVYPRLKTPRMPVFWSVAVLEALVLGLFLCTMLSD